MMIHTNALESSAKIGTSYLDCLRGPDLRRTGKTYFLAKHFAKDLGPANYPGS
jgi:hypothetical protein